VRLTRLPAGLRVRASDEGRGGADDGSGSGLLGIRRRVAALDGTFALTSPVGGPTVIEVELPCVW
jgi:signal transduction histidine kinase